MASNENDLLIIYTSKNGRTGGMVEPIRQGMIEGGANVTVRTVEEVTWQDMLAAQGIIVGTPVRFGGVDWQIKRLFDVTAYQDYPGPLSGKAGGAFAGGGRPGSGAELALLSMIHILLNHGMVIQGNAHSSHYGPIALRESSLEDVKDTCKAWGNHWAQLVRRLMGHASV
jgi:NAD(P)H dehydrogenase (quinone)